MCAPTTHYNWKKRGYFVVVAPQDNLDLACALMTSIVLQVEWEQYTLYFL